MAKIPALASGFAHAPDDLRERLAAAFGTQAICRHDTRQATIVLTITDTTPATINAMLADPRTDHDTTTSAARDTPADISRTSLAR
jgi:hypothetical protein